MGGFWATEYNIRSVWVIVGRVLCWAEWDRLTSALGAGWAGIEFIPVFGFYGTRTDEGLV